MKRNGIDKRTKYNYNYNYNYKNKNKQRWSDSR